MGGMRIRAATVLASKALVLIPEQALQGVIYLDAMRTDEYAALTVGLVCG